MKIIDVKGVVNGKKNSEVELDAYGVNPIHAVAEYKSVLWIRDKDRALAKVRMFVSKVKFLHSHVGKLPLAFFCVGKIDPALISDARSILDSVDGKLVSFLDDDEGQINPTFL